MPRPSHPPRCASTPERRNGRSRRRTGAVGLSPPSAVAAPARACVPALRPVWLRRLQRQVDDCRVGWRGCPL